MEAQTQKKWGPERWGPKGGARRVEAPKGGGPEGWRSKPRKSGAQKGGAPKGGGPKGGGPKFRAFFSLSRHRFAVSVSLWGSSRGILVVFLKRRGAQNVHVWSSRGVVCESWRPGLVGPPGFHTTTREPKRENENCGGRREKKRAKFWAVRRRVVRWRVVRWRVVRRRGGFTGGGSSGRVHRQWGAGFGVSGSVQVFRDENRTEQ